MKRTVVSLVAGMLGLQACGEADSGKVTAPPTERLVQFCASEAEDYHDGFCTDYLLGYAYALDGRSGSGVCVPDGIGVRQLRDVAIRYLRDHPDAQQQDASIAIPAALSAGFPCNG